MKTLLQTVGLLMVCGGFLWGALAAVQHTEQVQWTSYLQALSVGIVGIILMRTVSHQQARSAHTLVNNMDAVTNSLVQIVNQIRELNHEKIEIDTYALRHRIDKDFHDNINTFIDARESIAHQYGLQAYADIMSSFATAERYLNRVWSASADGYIDEAHNYLDHAQDQFTDSLERLQQLSA
jgi:hypothetical protein